MTLAGSVAQIDATLGAANNLVYVSQAGFYGTDTLTMFSNDGGSSGSGGPKTDTDTVAITVLAGGPMSSATLHSSTSRISICCKRCRPGEGRDDSYFFPTTSASTIVTPWPCGCTSTGLSSISEISLRCCAASSETCAINCDSAATSAFARAAKSLQQRRGLQLIQHRGRLGRAHRRRAIDHVAEQFGGDAAEPDHDHRPEGRIRQRADDDLDALFRHRPDQHALDRGVGPVLLRAVQQRLIGR